MSSTVWGCDAGLPPGSLQMNDYLMTGTLPVAQVPHTDCTFSILNLNALLLACSATELHLHGACHLHVLTWHTCAHMA